MRCQCSYCQAILDIEGCEPGELVQCEQCQRAITTPPSATSPGALIGDFIIKRELGMGCMGTVYLAHQTTLDRDVAIKILRPSYAEDQAAVESFLRQARAAAAVNHPNIVQAYAVNSENGLFYFVMEYIDGKTLRQLLAEKGQLPAPFVIDIAQDIVAALGLAWKERKIAHRNIKPGNIMMTSAGHTKLADFGLARNITVTTPSGSTDLFGTPQYIAPELLSGCAPDARSDIYSLGCTLYHLISGNSPGAGQTPEERINQQLISPLPPLPETAPDVAPGLAAMIQLMTAKRPEQRYPDYDLIAADLKRVKAGNLPAYTAIPDAQHPLNGDSNDPFAGSSDSEAFVATSTVPHRTPTNGPAFCAAPETTSGHPQNTVSDTHKTTSKMPIMLGVLVLLLVLAGSRTWFTMARNDNQGGSTDIYGGETNAITTLRAMIRSQKPEPEILAELHRLAATMAPGKTGYNDFLAVAAPYVEKALTQARKADIKAENDRWQALANTARAEAERIAATEAQKTAEAQKATEEARRQAAAATEAQRLRNRLNEQQAVIRDQMLQKTNALDFSGAKILLSPMLASKDPAAKSWAEWWTKILNDADNYYKMIRNSRSKLTGVKIPVLADKNSWQIDKVVYDKVSIKYVRLVVNDEGKDCIEEQHDSVEIDQLLFPQLEAINHKLAETEGLAPLELGQLSATFMLARGAYLAHIANLLQKLRVPQAVRDEVANLNGRDYMHNQLQFFSKLDRKQANALAELLHTSDPTAFAAIAEDVRAILRAK